MTIDPRALAAEIIGAYAANRMDIVPPTARPGGFDLDAAYEVERELVRHRHEKGHHVVGLKVGYANRAMWHVLGLKTLAWASLYEDTVHFVNEGNATLSLGGLTAPKIEPEIVFKLRHPLPTDGDPAAVLGAVDWLALGFEIIDCVYADWKFQPADFVASYGLHAALVVGEPHHVQPDGIASLIEQLTTFRVGLLMDDEVVAEGSGKNSLGSPALCLGELAAALGRRQGAHPLTAGSLVSSGTLAGAQFIAPDETWTAVVEGLPVSGVSLTTIA